MLLSAVQDKIDEDDTGRMRDSGPLDIGALRERLREKDLRR